MNTMAVVLEQPEHLALSRLDLTEPPKTTWWSTSTGAASAPAPSGCSGPGACRLSRAWAIRWCRATNRSAASSHAGADVRAPGRRAGVRARRALLRRGARPVRRRGLAAGRAGPRAVPIDAQLGRATACCSRSPRRRYHAIAGGGSGRSSARPDRRPRRARPAARAPDACSAGYARADGLGTQPGRSARCARATRWSHPDDDPRRDYRAIYDVSGDADAPRHADRAAWRPAARSCSPASTASRCPSPSRPPSCARRGSASPPNGSAADLARGAATRRDRARCRSTA